MSRPVVPLRDLAMRLPTAGRIRLGKKGAKGQPMKLGSFRFTSTDRQAVEQIAATYGGEVKPWSDPKAGAGQFEVITDATEIRVALPPDPLGGSPSYELWSGGGCQRRCDGETVEMLVAAQDGMDLQTAPCICDAKGELECKLTLRLSLLLPDIRFVGTWRIDTHSWNAATEIPGMVEVIRNLQDKGIQRAVLRVEERVQVLAGKTRKYPVPVLGLDASVEQLAAGSAAIGQLATSSTPVTIDAPALEAGAPADDGVTEYTRDLDDEVVDAELVDDVEPTSVVIEGREVQPSSDPPTAGRMKRLMALVNGSIGDDHRHEWASNELGRPVESFKELTADEVERLIEILTPVGAS